MPSSSFPDPASSATPAAWRQFGHNLLRLGPLPPGRWLFSLRAGFCVAAPVVVGLAAGDLHAGMMAAIGGLTGLYGSGRPYASRALELALVALAFGLAVALGDWVGQAWPLAVVPVVAVIAMLATWLCNALRVGPPGAYLFMLACAAGSAMPAADFSPLAVDVIDAPPTLKLGEINARLGFTLSADFLARLGFVAHQERSSRLYHERDWPHICAALIRHIQAEARPAAGK